MTGESGDSSRLTCESFASDLRHQLHVLRRHRLLIQAEVGEIPGAVPVADESSDLAAVDVEHQRKPDRIAEQVESGELVIRYADDRPRERCRRERQEREQRDVVASGSSLSDSLSRRTAQAADANQGASSYSDGSS